MTKVEPIILKYEDGEDYTLEFSKESVVYAEKHGFVIEEVMSKMMTRVPELFHYAFRMHHPQVSKEKTDKILFEDLGGVTEKLSNRLMELYMAPYEALVNDSGAPKNPKLTVLL